MNWGCLFFTQTNGKHSAGSRLVPSKGKQKHDQSQLMEKFTHQSAGNPPPWKGIALAIPHSSVSATWECGTQD